VQFTVYCRDDNESCGDTWIWEHNCDCTFATTWHLYGDLAAPPPPPRPVHCEPYSTSASWMRVASCAGCTATYTETVGTQTSTGQASTRTWQSSVERSITRGIEVSAGLGFSFGQEGVGSVSGTVTTTGSRSNTFTSSTARALATTASQSFQESTETQHSREYTGWLWQFQFGVNDTCGGAIIRTNHFAQTDGGNEPPCCIPTHTLDPAQAHGACTGIDSCLTNVGGCNVATCLGLPPSPPAFVITWATADTGVGQNSCSSLNGALNNVEYLAAGYAPVLHRLLGIVPYLLGAQLLRRRTCLVVRETWCMGRA